MKQGLSTLSFLFFLVFFAANSFAQGVTQAEADTLFDFAEAADPGLFSPPAATQQVNAVGADWFLRFYAGSEVFLAVNANGTGPFFEGDVYALGGPFGADPVFIDTLANLLALIENLTADNDNDGVSNADDACADTQAGAPVNAEGCSAAQLGIMVDAADAEKLFDFAEGFDPAAFSPPAATEILMDQGISWYARTWANSGVSLRVSINGVDDLLAGNVFAFGGPFGVAGTFIDTLANLIAFIDSQPPADDDNDGVPNTSDQCPDTPAGATVNTNGCSQAQLDDDNDNVNNTADLCPDTPAGETVNADGCSASQQGGGDSDNDGVSDAADLCPDTAPGAVVDANGCSEEQNNGGDPQYIVNPGSGACHVPVLPAEGTIAEYRTSFTGDEGTLSTERTEEWVSVSEMEIVTRSTRSTVTPLGSMETVSTTTQLFDMADNLIFLTEQTVETSDTTTIPGLPPLVTMSESVSTFDPWEFVGPKSGYCVGMILYFPSVTQTQINIPDTFMMGPIVSLTDEATVTVIAVNESITVEAGTFTTYHLQSVTEEGTLDTWIDQATSILVKIELRDTETNIVGGTELISLSTP